MENLLKFIIPLCVATACGGADSSTTESENNDSLKIAVDSAVVLENQTIIDLPTLLNKYTIVKSFPFKTDSAYFEDISNNYSTPLSRQEVIFLSNSILSTDFTYTSDYIIADFMFIDSLKAIDKYDGYVDTLDLAMTKESDAFVTEKLILDDSTTLLLWYVTYSTYEACPYGYGAYLFASVLQNDKIISCVQLGEDSGGADAPYWGSTLTTFKLTKTGAKITKINANGGDEDEDGNEIVESSTENFELLLVNNVWVEKK